MNLYVLFLLLFLSINAQNTKLNVVILGVENHTSKINKKSYNIGFGLKNTLAELLYDSGKFTLINSSPEIKSQLERYQKYLWFSDTDSIPNMPLIKKVDYFVIVRIIKFIKRKTGFSVGFAHKETTSFRIITEIELRSDSKTIKTRGMAISEIGKSSFFLSIDKSEKELRTNQLSIAVEMSLKNALKKILNDL